MQYLKATTPRQQTMTQLQELCRDFIEYGHLNGSEIGAMERLAREYARHMGYVRDPRLDRPRCRQCDTWLAGGDACPEHQPNEH